MTKFLKLLGLFLFLLSTGMCCAQSDKIIVINKETANLVVNIRYPQGFSPVIDKKIKDFIDEQLNKLEEVASDDHLPSDLPGKNGLYIKYKIMFDKKSIQSFLFSVSTNVRGAAHPDNTTVTFNFKGDKYLTLMDVLKQNALPKMAEYCQKYFLKQGHSDAKWIAEGTKPTEKNYRNWFFSDKGLAIVFDTYQVQAYVYGPQKVLLPKTMIKTLVNSDISDAVWGH